MTETTATTSATRVPLTLDKNGHPYQMNLTYDALTDSWTGQCTELPGVITQGKTLPEAVENGYAALITATEWIDAHQSTDTQAASAPDDAAPTG